VQFVDGDGQALESVIVELVLLDSIVHECQQPNEIAVDQVDGEFVPTVSVISAGNAVSFPNSNDILHHVYSFSPAKTFNIPLYGRGSNTDYREEFVTAGAVEIGCNIHDWMLAYIYVAETELTALHRSAIYPLGNLIYGSGIHVLALISWKPLYLLIPPMVWP